MTKRRLAEIVFLTIGIALVTVLLHFGLRKFLHICYPNAFEDEVLACAKEYDLDPSLLMAVIYTESHFDAEAQSVVGATGLMQLMEETFEWAQIRAGIPEEERLASDQLTDPKVNIRYGSYVLYLLKEEFPNEDTALAAYNAGIGNVRDWLQNSDYSDDGILLKAIPFTETEEYVKRVRAAQTMYRQLYAYP
ncbi:MAG: lytic transglycosylase domain-containing protein [Clostridia bacterium]|nr:lytic transglycosylase domain-containing protein [Clostridia bacterium]